MDIMKPLIDTINFGFLRGRVRSFVHALRGITLFFQTTVNARIQFGILIFVIGLGLFLKITTTEWIMLILTCGFVFSAEAFNTAIEIDMDLTSPEFHPYAKNVKDVAAGAVLISALTATCVGVLIFGHYFF